MLSEVAALGRPWAWVPGNHDLSDNDLPNNADGRVLEVAGLRVGGIGGAGPARFGFAYEWSEDDVRARSHLDCDVLLVHTPPLGTALAIVGVFLGYKRIGGIHIGVISLAVNTAVVCAGTLLTSRTTTSAPARA